MGHFDYDVFLSFASLNESVARTLYNQLIRSGLDVFWSDETLKRNVGMSWPKVIEEALETSKHMVLLWTEEAKQSHWVEEEYRAFHSETVGKKSRLLIPVLGNGQGSESLPLFLRQRQTYALNGDLEKLVTSLGGNYVPVEQENERLRQELEKVQEENRLLKQSSSAAKKAEYQKTLEELDSLKTLYAELENRSSKESKEWAEDRKLLLVDIAAKDSEINAFKQQVADLEGKLKSAEKSRKAPVISVKGLTKTFTDDHGIEFILIEPGSFMMGDEEFDWAKPVHKVEITKPFYLGKYQVTQAEWKAITGKSPSKFKGECNPVECVSWTDMVLFLRKMNNGEDVYRMPTEAQWEYACRAGTTAAYSFGDSVSELDQYAWYGQDLSNGSTHPVGEKKPNPWGLYDMHGNVWERVRDLFAEDYYEQFQNETAVDPTGPKNGTACVIRGGGWNSDGAYKLRSAHRDYGGSGGAGYSIGFRLVRTIP